MNRTALTEVKVTSIFYRTRPHYPCEMYVTLVGSNKGGREHRRWSKSVRTVEKTLNNVANKYEIGFQDNSLFTNDSFLNKF